MPKLCPKTNQPAADVVYTPDDLALKIVKHFKPSGKIIEPCKGGGAFTRAMPTADWCELALGKDYLTHVKSYDWLVTNPPWSKIREFLQHAIACKTQHIVLLVNINALMTKARLNLIHDSGYSIKEIACVDTPKEFPASGFQLAAIHICRGKFATTFSRL